MTGSRWRDSLTFENEYCRVELILDDPERTHRDVDVVSGTVRFEATDRPLSIHCQPKIGLGVKSYGADIARRVSEYDEEIKLEPVPSEAGADDVAGLGSVNRVGALRGLGQGCCWCLSDAGSAT